MQSCLLFMREMIHGKKACVAHFQRWNECNKRVWESMEQGDGITSDWVIHLFPFPNQKSRPYKALCLPC